MGESPPLSERGTGELLPLPPESGREVSCERCGRDSLPEERGELLLKLLPEPDSLRRREREERDLRRREERLPEESLVEELLLSL